MVKKIFLVASIVSSLFLFSCTSASYKTYKWNDAELYNGSLLGKKVTVEFVIYKVYNPGNVCYFNSSANWEKDFAVQIAKADFSKFVPKFEEYYDKQKVRVTGILRVTEAYPERPIVWLKNPSQIKIVK